MSASLTTFLGACAVREQSFGCEGVSENTSADEFVMTPTSLRFQSITYRFTEERKTSRIYTHKESGERIEFNTANGLLQRQSSQWRCKRIEL
jgi:hypothetical protein